MLKYYFQVLKLIRAIKESSLLRVKQRKQRIASIALFHKVHLQIKTCMDLHKCLANLLRQKVTILCLQPQIKDIACLLDKTSQRQKHLRK